MIQAKDGIRLNGIGIIAGAAVWTILLCACSQNASTAATTKAVVGTPAQNADMEEVVITASRPPTPKG
jgi:hypothetical protein